MVNAMGDDFGIRLGGEFVAEIDEPGAQRLVVLDDAVVHDGDAVARYVRMSVAGGRQAVGRPPGVRDADMPRDRLGVQAVLQHLHLAESATARQLMVGAEHRDPRGVVTAIFEAPQTLHKNGYGISLRHHTDDSAHRDLGSAQVDEGA